MCVRRMLNKEAPPDGRVRNHRGRWPRDFLPEKNQDLVQIKACKMPAQQNFTTPTVKTPMAVPPSRFPCPDMTVYYIICPCSSAVTCVYVDGSGGTYNLFMRVCAKWVHQYGFHLNAMSACNSGLLSLGRRWAFLCASRKEKENVR